MNLEELANLRESVDFEAKGATDQLPSTFWETYCAFGNTYGGTIALGVKEDAGGALLVRGVAEPEKIRKAIFDGQNNKQQVSAPLLRDEDVVITTIDERTLILVHVPRAPRQQRPVYLGLDLRTGTYVRRGEGDYRVDAHHALRMLADAVPEGQDGELLSEFTRDDLDTETIESYRQLFRRTTPDHPWNTLANEEFLQQLGALRLDRSTRTYRPTFAGVLMFGTEQAIRDAVPDYFPEYREKTSSGEELRWDDRLIMDGTWTPNLFNFYQQAIRRLTRDLKVPFALDNLQRKGDTHVHEALREALVNTLTHADHRGRGSIVVEKLTDGFRFSNPGLMRIEPSRALEGGASDPRNPWLHRMFSQAGLGERAGSGLPKINRAWREQHWRGPDLVEDPQLMRTTLELRQVSLLPPEALQRLKERFGSKFESLGETGVLAVVLADVDGRVTNRTLQTYCRDHPSDLTLLLKRLVEEDMLVPHGNTSGAWYTLPPEEAGTEDLKNSSVKSPVNSPISSPVSAIVGDMARDPELLQIASISRKKQRLPPRTMELLVLELCVADWRSPSVLGELLMRDTKNLPLKRLVQAGELEMRHPSEPHHPGQAYRTTLAGKERIVDARWPR